MNLISKWMDFTAQSESPDSYHIWCALSTIASVIRRQVWVDMGFFNVYPNLYVVLVGPPGCRKSTPINISVDILSTFSDVHVSADATTREALIRAVKVAENPIELNNGKIYIQSPITIVSKELSVFIGTGNNDLLALLTDLYDAPNRWEYRTKHSGIDTLTGVWVNMLAASTPEWLRSSIPLTAIGGGFTSRVVFVVEYAPRHRRSMPILTADEEKLKQEIARDLEAISIKRGEMKMDAEAFMLFDKWYNTEAADNKCTDTMFKGYFDKKHIQLIKVAMLAALSKDRDVIDITDIEFGLKMLNTAEINMLEAFGAVGRSTMASNIHDAEMFIKDHKSITRQKLLGMMWKDVEPQYFDSVIVMLRDMGKVRVSPDKDGGFLYTWNDSYRGE